MKTLLFAILIFLMFGWLGFLALGIGAVVGLAWLAHNFVFVILIAVAVAYYHFCKTAILGKPKAK